MLQYCDDHVHVPQVSLFIFLFLFLSSRPKYRSWKKEDLPFIPKQSVSTFQPGLFTFVYLALVFKQFVFDVKNNLSIYFGRYVLAELGNSEASGCRVI